MVGFGEEDEEGRRSDERSERSGDGQPNRVGNSADSLNCRLDDCGCS